MLNRSAKNKTINNNWCLMAYFLALCIAFGVHQHLADNLINNSRTIYQADEGGAVVLSKLPNCTEKEQSIMNQQLPGFKSVYFATKCPDATWLQEYYIATAAAKKASLKSVPATGIYLGCNKGMDAISALRMLSYDKQFDSTRWKQTLDPFGTMGSGACGQLADKSAHVSLLYTTETQSHLKELTRRHEASLLQSAPQSSTTNQAQVYCVEAMPDMAELLASTAKALNWDTSFHVTHAAMSDTDGEAYFPKSSSQMGVEFMGLSDCTDGSLNSTSCQAVPQWSLDTFVDNNQIHGDIDILSIDVEGYDYEVLMGSKRTLKRVKYLEFEINQGGRWPEHSLEAAIDTLSESGFDCYWAGAAGHLWRITGCFVPLFEGKYWSNVACVRLDNSFLATRMEETFQETLAANITYDNRWMDGTDGILLCGRLCRKEFRRQKAFLADTKR
jgi:FkbM family methyltransferase